jgi:hypothetical protein
MPRKSFGRSTGNLPGKPRPTNHITKTPFGGVPVGLKNVKPQGSELLPGRKALELVAKPNSNVQDFGRLTPIGSGALNQDFLSQTSDLEKNQS